MSFIKRKFKHTRKPTVQTQFDLKNFEGNKSHGWGFIDQSLRESVTGIDTGSYIGSENKVANKERAIIHDNTSDLTELVSNASNVIPANGVTILVGYEKRDATLRASGGFGVNNVINTERCGVHLPYSDGTVYWDFGGAVSGSTRLAVSGLTVTGRHEWAFTSGSRGMEVWQDGIKVGSNAVNPTRTAGTDGYRLGYHAGTISDLANYYYFIVIQGQISESRLAHLGKNHNELYLPRTQYIPIAIEEAVEEVQRTRSGGRAKQPKKIPKKFKNPKIERLLAQLMAEREAVEETEQVIMHGYVQIDQAHLKRVEALKAELLAAVQKIEAKTRLEIAYQKYIYEVTTSIEKKYKQAMEDELIAILLLSL